MEKVKEENDVIAIQAKLLYDKNVLFLDATNWIQFGQTGDGN